MLNEVKSPSAAGRGASGGENTNNPQMGGDGQSPKTSTGMSPVVKGLVGIIVLAGVGYGGWYLGQNQKSNVKNQNDIVQDKNVKIPTNQPESPSPTATSTPDGTSSGASAKLDPTAGWKTYENKDYGFSFKYPGDWKIKDNIQADRSKQSSPTDSITLYKDNIENGKRIVGYVNPSGWGTAGEKISYSGTIKDRLLILGNKTVNEDNKYGELGPVEGIIRVTFDYNNDHYFFDSREFTDPSDEILFDQILSTFRFTK